LFDWQMKWGPRYMRVGMVAIGHRLNNLSTTLVVQDVSCNRFRYSHRRSWGTGQRKLVVDCTKFGVTAKALNWMERTPGVPEAARNSAWQALEGIHIAEAAGPTAMGIGAPENCMFAHTGCNQRLTVAARAVAEKPDTERDYTAGEPWASVG
jgi:hypothetical protein